MHARRQVRAAPPEYTAAHASSHGTPLLTAYQLRLQICAVCGCSHSSHLVLPPLGSLGLALLLGLLVVPSARTRPVPAGDRRPSGAPARWFVCPPPWSRRARCQTTVLHPAAGSSVLAAEGSLLRLPLLGCSASLSRSACLGRHPSRRDGSDELPHLLVSPFHEDHYPRNVLEDFVDLLHGSFSLSLSLACLLARRLGLGRIPFPRAQALRLGPVSFGRRETRHSAPQEPWLVSQNDSHALTCTALLQPAWSFSDGAEPLFVRSLRCFPEHCRGEQWKRQLARPPLSLSLPGYEAGEVGERPAPPSRTRTRTRSPRVSDVVPLGYFPHGGSALQRTSVPSVRQD